MQQMAREFGWALRSLRRSPGLALTAILVLTLGLGGNLTIFSFFNAALLRPLPGIRGENELLLVGRVNRGQHFMNLSYPDYVDLRTDATSFRHLAAHQPMAMSVAAAGVTERVRGEAVSWNYFETLQTRIALGRGFLPHEDSIAGEGAVAVITHDYWRRRFQSSPAVLGRDIVINSAHFTVVGIAEPGFRGNYLPAPSEILIPISMYDRAELAHRDSSWLSVFGRLAPGATRAAAAQQLDALGQAYRAKHTSGFEEMSFRPARFNSVDEDIGTGDASAMMSVLAALTMMALLLVCANVANLLLARATARTREIAIRLSMGAGRASVIRQFLFEGFVLAGIAASFAAIMGSWFSERMAALIPAEGGGQIDLTAPVDTRVALAAFLLALAATLAFAGPAAFLASRASLTGGLKPGEAGSGGSAGRSRVRNAFAAAQVALCLALLACAGLVGRSVSLLYRTGDGLPLDRVALASVDLESAKYTQATGLAFWSELQGRLRALPGVEAAALARIVPFSGSGMGLFGVWGGDLTKERAVQPYTNIQSPGYFDAIGMPLLHGRDFSDRDTLAARPVAIINETLARRLFPGGDAVGQTLYARDAAFGPYEIIGVARDGLAPNPHDGVLPAMHLSLHQVKDWNLRMTIHLRASGPLAPRFAEMRQTVASMDRNLPLYGESTWRHEFDGSFFMIKMAAAIAGFTGVMALVVSTVGLYGMMAFTVRRRTREIGVRLALGASPRRALAAVLSGGMRSAVTGVAVGLALSFAVTRVMRSVLFGVEPNDPVVLAGAALFVFASAMGACWLPARRAAGVEPAVALRYE